MGFEKAHIFGKIEIDVAATSAGTFALSTDVPGGAGMAQRFSFTIPVTNRRVLRSRLPGTMKGHLVSATYTPGGGASELYGARVWVRELPAGEWYWFPLPVVETPAAFQEMKLPVDPTPDSFGSMKLPVDPTPDTFSPMKLPVDPTPDSFGSMQVPVAETPVEFAHMTIPVEATPGSYSELKIPVQPTPPVPQWIDVEVDQ